MRAELGWIPFVALLSALAFCVLEIHSGKRPTRCDGTNFEIVIPCVPKLICRTEVRDWLKTKQGMARVMDEIKKRKAIQSLRVGVIDGTIAELKVKKGLDRASLGTQSRRPFIRCIHGTGVLFNRLSIT